MRKHTDREVDENEEGSEDDSEGTVKDPADRPDRICGDLYAVHHERRKQADLLRHQTVPEQAL